VFLQVVAFTTDVRNDFEAVRQTNLGNLTECRVRLLRRRGVHTGAHATTLGAVLQGRALALRRFRRAAFANQLIDGWHCLFLKLNKIDAFFLGKAENDAFLATADFQPRRFGDELAPHAILPRTGT
jgi:hypothetical protein